MAQLVFDLLRELRDLAQIAQEVRRRLVEDLEQEARLLVGSEEARCALVKLRDDGRLLEADGDDVLIRHDDGERQGIVAVLAAEDRHIRQDHDRVLLDVRMGALLIIECGAQEVGINLGEIADDLELVRRRIDDVDPGALLERLERQFLQWAALQGFIDLQHG